MMPLRRGQWNGVTGTPMALPRSNEAREFYRSAYERLEDARALFELKRFTGMIYLAGYAVECMLKALVMEAVRPRRRRDVRDSFRGAKAHDFNWLRGIYRQNGGADLPRLIVQRFSIVERWTIDLRYRSKAGKPAEALRFQQATADILAWIDGRL